jgi:hypothetical protein
MNTSVGSVKLVFIAANAWNSAQESWLKSALASPTTYTFIVRHEPSYDNTAPGVTPSETIINGSAYTMELLGHSHEYKKIDDQHVISGNGGAPLSNTTSLSYGFLFIQILGDGNVAVNEIDAATGMPVDSYRVTPQGKAVP